MTHAPDEPLDGDIGPAATAVPGRSSPAGEAAGKAEAAAEELRRYEAERAERRRRADAVAGRVAFWLTAALLAFLAYDSVATAVRAHGRGDGWLYPPATNAAIFALLLVGLLLWGLRRRRRGGAP
ncbi:hypothetical protein ACSNOI_04670 [Actinomadura kijaniata]|uniref:hypothetical protein n=1 Tax=Actinomadura kijaniata TaxID=46161 RepID=UPI003F1B3623